MTASMLASPSTPFPEHFGAVLHADAAEEALPQDSGTFARLRRLLVDRGALVLRGHRWELSQLENFARTLAPGALRYGGSRDQISADDAIQRAEQGMMEISLHSELAFTPLRPDTALFACCTPPKKGGQTFVGDGRRVAQMLSPSTREAFEAQRVRYHRRYPATAWQRMFGISDRDQLIARLDALPDFDYELRPRGVLDTWYTTSAFGRDLGGEPAFCNNISNMVEVEGIDGSTVTFEDGSLIEGLLRAELKWLLRAQRCPVGWRRGDVLIVDNRRIMHGRESFDDPHREIWVRFANLSS